MAITYPLALPSSPAPRMAELYIQRNQTGVPSNNGVVQITSKPGDKWVGKITLPILSAAQARDWLGFFDALQGMAGSFTMQHPDYQEMEGTAGGETGAVMGANQKGSEIVTDNWTPGKTFLRGDIIQIGATGAGCRMKRVLENALVDESGEVTLKLAPSTYTAHADNTPIYTENCKGYFRLAQSDVPIPSDYNRRHEIIFAIEEVLP